MPKNPNVKRVMVIGSGPIVIGQAAEFDYAGTQACRSLKEEGVEVILVNSNPATGQYSANFGRTGRVKSWYGIGRVGIFGGSRCEIIGNHSRNHTQCGGTPGVQRFDGTNW